MQFSWAGLREYLGNLWAKLTFPQRGVLVAAPLVVATVLIVLITWANKPDFVPIFTNLSDTEAGSIKKKLEDLKVQYQLADNGATILVPKQRAAEVRLDLADAGLPQGSKFSFDSLNQLHLGETDADRKLRYILGLQNELETTLKTLAGVEDARVHITSPEPSLFTETQKAATAGVTLKLTPGTTLKEAQVRGVANLLAASVEGLEADNITVVDTSGNVLSDLINKNNDPIQLTGTQIQMQQAFEDNMQKSVQTMLEKVFGPGKIVVRANVSLDFDKIKIVQEKNGQGALVSKQTASESSSSQGQSTGSANPGAPVYNTPANSGATSNKSQSTENYQVDTTHEEREVSPGSIKRLSISVLADSNRVTEAQLADIKSAVASAVGFTQDRGDQIEVAALPFDKTGIQEEKDAMAAAARRQSLLNYVKLGSGVFLAFIFLLILWRSRVSRAEGGLTRKTGQAVDVFDSLQQAQLEAAAAKMAEKRVKSAEQIEKAKVKEAVESYSRSNPGEVAKLVKAWLAEER